MTAVASVVALGFLLGMRHATDVDHVAAVATIVSRARSVKLAAWAGALWGLGHTVTIVLVGVPIILFNWAIAPRIGLALEFIVGLMLILLGLRNLLGARWWGGALPGATRAAVVHVHTRVHGDDVHSHRNGHAPGQHSHRLDDTPLGRLDGGLGFYQAARAFVVGIVHGLAGSAAVALLVLTTIQDPGWAVAYLLIFGIGTVAGMVLITTLMTIPLAGVTRTSSAHRRLRVATGLLSFGFGVFLAYRIGVVDGLFSAAPRWTAH